MYADKIKMITKSTINMVLGANQFVPHCRKQILKFWWDEELDLLKEAIESNLILKAADKPKHGPFFSKRQSCRLQYRKRFRENQNTETSAYSNDLHDALMEINSTTFWKVWRSKFECKTSR